jgi:hypothetical protein
LNSLSTQQVDKVGFFQVVRSIAIGGLLAGLIAGLAACGMLEQRKPQEMVTDRAKARWEALVKGDVAAAYAYLSPSSKAVMTLGAYVNSIKLGFWKSAAVERVECATADSCEVVTAIEYEMGGRRIKTPIKETWIREGSNWWYVQR